MTTETPLISLTIETLKEDLEAGNAAALDAFWETISQQDTPLIESIEGDDKYSLVTFLWRAAEEDQGVEVVNNLSGGDAVDAMTHLPETDLWYKTYRVHNETRESYQFAVGGSNVTDPLNSRQHVFPDDEEIEFTGWVSSVFEMPDAPPQPWTTARPNVPKGQIHASRMHSEVLDNEYRVWVYTPPGYTADGAPYGFLLVLDGWVFLNLIPTPIILDNLQADGLLPPLAAVMVGSLGSPFHPTRFRDLGCYPPFAEFLTQELLPWARGNYHLSNNPAQTTVAGSSLGGLMAAFIGLQHSEIFGNVISLSGAFFWRPEDDHEDEWLGRQYAASPKLPLNFYLEAGLLETEIGSAGLGWYNILLTTRHMRDVLQAKGYPVHYSEFSGGHNPMNWQGTFANALLALLGKSTNDKDD